MKSTREAQYSLEMTVGGRHLRFARYDCATLEDAQREIAEVFRVAYEIRDETPPPEATPTVDGSGLERQWAKKILDESTAEIDKHKPPAP